jgi:hypothetical protein
VVDTRKEVSGMKHSIDKRKKTFFTYRYHTFFKEYTPASMKATKKTL